MIDKVTSLGFSTKTVMHSLFFLSKILLNLVNSKFLGLDVNFELSVVLIVGR